MKYFAKQVIETSRVVLRKIKYKISDYLNPYPFSNQIISNPENISISLSAEIKPFVVIQCHSAKVVIGDFTQLNPFCTLYAGGDITIGSNVMIGPGCVLVSGNHDYKSTLLPMRFQGSIKEEPIVIYEDVWIGANCTITAGVQIGKGSVIAANSVVNKNVEPYAIYGGVPARMIGTRK